jgi:saccharopine dehydrogenase-like NADP-dependent oxidoreductase
VGGLPIIREKPFEYKAPFSPIDVIEEYTRPARIVENNNIVTYPALSDIELINFPQLGTLEAFYTDGLRTLLHTMKIPFMKEKTMRYPGHAELMTILRDIGFFNMEFIDLKEGSIRPIDVTTKLLFPKLELAPQEEDLTIMRILIEGTQNKQKVRYQYDLYDKFDKESNTTSMARTTGYTCAIIARLVGNGIYKQKGMSPPEFVGKNHDCYKFVLTELGKRNIHFEESKHYE